MDTKWYRLMEERLSRLERFEKARFRRKKIYWERFYFALVMICGMVIAAGLGGLVIK